MKLLRLVLALTACVLSLFRAGTIVRAYCVVPDGMDYSMGCMATPSSK